MIKIIKVGSRKKIECVECGSLLSYEEEDIETATNPKNGWADKRFIECPQCKSKIYISATR